jgi:threonine dehydratase
LPTEDTSLPTPASLEQARQRIQPHLVVTPVAYDESLGVWLKWENQQVTGSFKPRGALNKILGLPAGDLARGLIACSAGNHGQGAALAARIAGAKVTVYASRNAAPIKIEKMRALGAEVVLAGESYGEAEAAAMAAAREQGRVWVSPYNDPEVMAGQGTLALELREQCPAAARWVVPVGGGGLIAGMLAGAPAGLAVVGAQAEASPYLHHEFHCHSMAGAVDLPSLADGLSGTIEPGSATIAAIHGAADVQLVSETRIAEAIAYAYQRHGQVIEGSGAVGLALRLDGRLAGDGTTLIVVTGANIDPAKHARIAGA